METYLKQKILFVDGERTDSNGFLRRVGELEEQLHRTRKQIVFEEAALLSLEKKRVVFQQNLDRALRQSYRSLALREEEAGEATQKLRKKMTGKIRLLSRQAHQQQIQNAVWEQKMLQRELETLQRGFSKALKKAEKK